MPEAAITKFPWRKSCFTNFLPGKIWCSALNRAFQLCFNVIFETDGRTTGVAHARVCLHDSEVVLQNEGLPQPVIRRDEPHITAACHRNSVVIVFKVTEIFLISNRFYTRVVKRACDVRGVVRGAIIQNEKSRTVGKTELKSNLRTPEARAPDCSTEQ